MSAKCVLQFVDKVKGSQVLGKQNELQQVLDGPLALCREKIGILQTDEAVTVLGRVDPVYNAQLQRNVEGIFEEEIGKAESILEEIDASLGELQTFLDTLLQRLQHNQNCGDLARGCYEDGRAALVYLKLKTNLLRLQLSVPLDEPLHPISCSLEQELEHGDFLLRLSKLEVSANLLEANGQ